MSELRKNPFTGEWTLCAENRKNRPYEFLHKTEVKAKGSEQCPFCSGHEEKTTAPLYQDGDDDCWQIRVFPNMFPAVSKEAKDLCQNPFYELISGKGQHEVLVDTPYHEVTIDQFSAQRLTKIFGVLQQRYCKMVVEEDVKYIQIFKNCGPSAGMSIRHSHWQILGLPMVPQREVLMQGHMQQESCLFCKMLQFEKEQALRVVMENEDFLAITPYASRFPYELWICPKRHISTFANVTEGELEALAVLLQKNLQKVCVLKEDVGYNICLIDGQVGGDFHWHLEILPRIGGFAGFEFATGSYINAVLPEQAADYYRRKIK
ncbi:galactose-1-phosphate uridylyltransferase [Anaerotignum sp.]|uniref:galactose-1-phosphate uridylyltransferase n=1 Tax=Anaerotignum sp. TaxID=2039241 RepID=UPI0033215557